MRILLGLKAWSTNVFLIREAKTLRESGDLDYVEVFCVPGSGEETGKAWAAAGLPYVVHAPHSLSGLNFADPSARVKNAELAAESLRFADRLGAEAVIFHPGTKGRLDETIRQAKALRDDRMLMENKPLLGLDGSTCVGSTPEEIERLTEELGAGFCLDFGHAIAAANAHRIEAFEFLGRFLALGPRMYHLTDGDFRGETDRHDPYGAGSFPLGRILGLIPSGARVTDESKRADGAGLGEYLSDREYLRRLLAGGNP